MDSCARGRHQDTQVRITKLKSRLFNVYVIADCSCLILIDCRQGLVAPLFCYRKTGIKLEGIQDQQDSRVRGLSKQMETNMNVTRSPQQARRKTATLNPVSRVAGQDIPIRKRSTVVQPTISNLIKEDTRVRRKSTLAKPTEMKSELPTVPVRKKSTVQVIYCRIRVIRPRLIHQHG